MICDFMLYAGLSLTSISILAWVVVLLDDSFSQDKK